MRVQQVTVMETFRFGVLQHNVIQRWIFSVFCVCKGAVVWGACLLLPHPPFAQKKVRSVGGALKLGAGTTRKGDTLF